MWPAGGHKLVCGIRTDASLLCWTYGGDGARRAERSLPDRQGRPQPSLYFGGCDVPCRPTARVRENGEILCELIVDNYPGLTTILQAKPPGAKFEHLSLGYNPNVGSSLRSDQPRPHPMPSFPDMVTRTLVNPDLASQALRPMRRLQSLALGDLRLVPQFSANRLVRMPPQSRVDD